MSLSEPFIRRPVATTLITVAVALTGAIAFVVLPVAPLPQVDYPTINVNASLPGASADIMASSVATPLERELGHIAGVSEMTSSSSLGSTRITIQFDLNRDIDGAARDVQAAINAARTYLPANLPSNPSYNKSNPSDSPIMILAVTSDKYSAAQMFDEASTVIQQKLSQVRGVGQVQTQGGALPAVRIDVNPQKLAAYGLTISNVKSVVSLQNADVAQGQITDGRITANIVTNDQITKADDYKPLIIGYNNGASVRLQDVADVTDSVANTRTGGYLDGKRAVNLQVFRQPGANIINTVDRLKKELDSIRATIPKGMDLTLVMERTTTIKASVNTVETTLLIAIALVILVVFIFLRNWRATLIPGVAVPVSLIGTCAVMYLCGYTIDNLSLMALTIATGFVVDDAIVVMENITRHMEEGMKPFEAALQGAREISFTVFSISISLIAVFIPILLMGGIMGRLFREFAVTLSTAILVSMAVSLTTTPTMCAYFLKPETKKSKHGFLYNLSERFFDGMLAYYRKSLIWFLDRTALTLCMLAAVIALNVVLIIKLPKGFFPLQDTGNIASGVRGPQDASYAVMLSAVQRLGKIVGQEKSVAHTLMYTGASNGGFLFIVLKPPSERTETAFDVINVLRPKLATDTVAQSFPNAQQDLRIGGRQSPAQYQYTLEADSNKQLLDWGPKIEAAMKKLPGFEDVNSDQQTGGLDTYLTYDRVNAAKLGLTIQSLDSALYSAFGQEEVSIIYTPLNQYYSVLEVAPQYFQSPSNLNDTYLLSSGKSAIPIFTVSSKQATTIPLAVNHTGLFPSITISFNLASGLSLSDAQTAINGMMQDPDLNIPTSIHGAFSGTALAFQDTWKTLPWLIGVALLAIYIVLGILYENLVHPVTIMSTIFSASAGALLGMWLYNLFNPKVTNLMELDLISIIGIILLIGIVKKNAIMMIDFALQAEKNEGKGPADSIFEACMLRFRPIMMTTMAALFGALPLAFGTGTGSELRKPLGISIVGGLIVSQLLTLYTTPVVYLTFDRFRLWIKGKKPDVFHHGEEPLPSDA